MELGSESGTVAFKSDMRQLDKGLISLTAMINRSNHGTVYFGVDDTGYVSGLQVDAPLFDKIRYTARKNTEAWDAEQVTEVERTARYCAGLGYSRAAGRDAALRYLTAARDTATGPDWAGFRRAIRDVGLVGVTRNTPHES